MTPFPVPPSATSTEQAFTGKHLADPRHPSRRLFQLADTLQHNHPKMAEELREQAASVADLRPYTAHATLQNSRAYLQTRHEHGIGCRERNVWLSAVIGNLPSPDEETQTEGPLCTISIASTQGTRTRQPKDDPAPPRAPGTGEPDPGEPGAGTGEPQTPGQARKAVRSRRAQNAPSAPTQART